MPHPRWFEPSLDLLRRPNNSRLLTDSNEFTQSDTEKFIALNNESKISVTARGVAVPATPDEIKLEDAEYYIGTDLGFILVTDSGDTIGMNIPDVGYTHPNLHRRMDPDIEIPSGSEYSFVKYDKDGNPFRQSTVIGVWDGVHSYRTTTTYTHDEESTTCEIP